MYDLNFLQVTEEKKRKSPLVTVLVILIILALAGYASFYSFMFLKAAGQELKIAQLKAYIDSDEVSAQYAEINQLQSEIDSYKQQRDQLALLDQYLLAADYTRGDLLDDILAASPTGVDYDSISFRSRFIEIQARADQQVNAAIWLHQLKELPAVESANISSLNFDSDAGQASVALSCVLQEVSEK